eukprot:5903759-Prymnesium_polylepis.1
MIAGPSSHAPEVGFTTLSGGNGGSTPARPAAGGVGPEPGGHRGEVSGGGLGAGGTGSGGGGGSGEGGGGGSPGGSGG